MIENSQTNLKRRSSNALHDKEEKIVTNSCLRKVPRN